MQLTNLLYLLFKGAGRGTRRTLHGDTVVIVVVLDVDGTASGDMGLVVPSEQ